MIYTFPTATESKRRKLRKDDLFLTARQKAYRDFELAKEMIDTVDGMLRTGADRIARINENWHLHAGEWPEMDEYLGKDSIVVREQDGAGLEMNLYDFIVHHPKINNVTNYIMGDIIAQPLIPIVKDFSAQGRKFRQEERLRKLKEHYYQTIYAPQAELVRQKYMQENGIEDMMALTPDEQRQVEVDLRKRMKESIPRQVMDDLKRIQTPDERIKQILLNYDIKAYEIEEKFVQGGEQAVITHEEYYRIGRRGVKPTFEVLNSKWVTWSGSEETDYVEDGIMAKYESYLGVHDFVAKHGRGVIKKQNFLNKIRDYFCEIPGYFRNGNGLSYDDGMDPYLMEAERDFVDAVAADPDLVQNDWRTRAGQQEIAALYSNLSTHSRPGFGIREVYCVFKWTEMMSYVQRQDDDGKIREYLFSSDYRKDETRDLIYRRFPVNRVYHGTKVADRFYIGVEPVPWQFFGGVYDYDPKLTICGRNYGRENGVDLQTTLIEPAKQYQFRYNVSASKLEELEKNDIGKILFWETSMKPVGWSDAEYIEAMVKGKNVPYQRNQLQNTPGSRPVFAEDAGSTAKMQEYRANMDFWEREMYRAVGLNKDTLGQAGQYQSNALTQSNIQGSQKQLLNFHNKRRLVKQRVLNYFNNVSMLAFLEDEEKQKALLDDFARSHVQVNADDIRGNLCPIYVVDDYSEAANVERIRAQILTMLQNGATVKDVIAISRAKSVSEMYDIAEIAEIKGQEQVQEAQAAEAARLQEQQQFMQELEKFRQEREDMRKERENQVKLAMAKENAMIQYYGADVDRNKVPDSLQRALVEMAARERMHEKDLEFKREELGVKERISKKRP